MYMHFHVNSKLNEVNFCQRVGVPGQALCGQLNPLRV